MSTKQLLCLLSAALVMVGVFMPLVSIPIMGTMSYVGNGRGDGWIVFALGLAAAGCALVRAYRVLPWLGSAVLACLAYTYYRFQGVIGEARAQAEKMRADLADNPFGGLATGMADTMVGAIQIQWGFGVLLVAAMLLMVGSVMAESRPALVPPVTAG